MSVDLKPCPWCCGQTLEQMDCGDESYFWCHSCGATGPINDEEGTLWNTRAPDPVVAVLEAEVARLREDNRILAVQNRMLLLEALQRENRAEVDRRAHLKELTRLTEEYGGYQDPAPSEKEAGQ